MRRGLQLAEAVLGLALALTPFCLFPVCAQTRPDGTPMGCWYSGVLITVLGAAVVLLAALGLWRRRLSSLAHAGAVGAALMGWMIPNGILRVEGWPFGLCADAGHACRAVTEPAAGALMAGIAAVGLLGLAWGFVSGGR
ncbi:MAG: DUF4418 family protein [Fretibacterium sp.]|nr:DUF4418 family protein [Fretibacterium sp.]